MYSIYNYIYFFYILIYKILHFYIYNTIEHQYLHDCITYLHTEHNIKQQLNHLSVSLT